MFQPSDIDALPTGLVVRHLPAQVQAMPSGLDGQAFRWEYRTTVSAMSACEILGFAAYRWDGAAWVPRNPDGAFFTAGDFAEWYAGAEGRIPAGGGWSDPRNFCTGAELVAGRTKWVFIAELTNGRRVKGEAIVELLGELEPRARASTDPVEQFHASAEFFRKQMAQTVEARLAYDEAGIKWLNDYVAANRDKLRGNAGWFDNAGSFLGECLRAIFDGQWVANAGEGDPWGIRLDDKLVVFPFTKLHKHMTDVPGGGESITGMLSMIRPMMAVNAHKARPVQRSDEKREPPGEPAPEPPAAAPPFLHAPPTRPSGGSWIPWRKK
jgi:hypothetical protein